MTDSAVLPTAIRVHLAHAAIQAIATSCSADILHIKGPALDASLLPTRTLTDPLSGGSFSEAVPRQSTDADVLVRPSHVARLMGVLSQHGWSIVTRFETGSAFEHAASLWHLTLGYVDVHRRFPGVQLPPEAAFDKLWAERHTVELAHAECCVPSVEAQRLILLLHAARGGGLRHPDAQLTWLSTSDEQQARTLALASEFRADVALAAATGRLDDYPDDPSTPLWRLFSEGHQPDRVMEWRARLQAETRLLGKARLLARSLLVNTDHVSMRLGRPVTLREIVSEYGRRFSRAAREGGALVRRSMGRSGGPDR